jgi:Spy/CpxP family protein refolding chaperone
MKTARAGGPIFWVGAAGDGRTNPESMEMRKTIEAALGGATLVLFLGAAVGSAQPPPSAERGPWMGRAQALTRFLGLSEQQQDQVRKLTEERRAEHQALREKLVKSREELQRALESASPDPAAIGELAIEGHRLRQQDRALREARDEAIRGLLSAEQRVRFDAWKALREGGPPEGGPGPRLERGHGRPPR